MAETSRCTGHCCKVFTLPFAPAQLRQEARAARRYRVEGRRPAFASVAFQARLIPETERVHEIVQWLGKRDGFHPLYNLTEHMKQWAKDNPHAMKNRNYYTCKLLQPNGDCGDYDNRPSMCRTYGVHEKCEHADCTRTESPLPAAVLGDVYICPEKASDA